MSVIFSDSLVFPSLEYGKAGFSEVLPPQALTFSTKTWFAPGIGEARVHAPKLQGSSTSALFVPDPLQSSGVMSPPPAALFFLQVVPCPEPQQSLKCPGWYICCSFCPNILLPLPALPALPLRLAQPGFPLPTPGLDRVPVSLSSQHKLPCLFVLFCPSLPPSQAACSAGMGLYHLCSSRIGRWAWPPVSVQNIC